MANNNFKKGDGLLAKLKKLFKTKKEDKESEAKRKEALRKAFDAVKSDIEALSAKKPVLTNKNEPIAITIMESEDAKENMAEEASGNILDLLQQDCYEIATEMRRDTFSGVHEIYKRATPFGLMKTNGRQIEFEHFDMKFYEILKVSGKVPIYRSVADLEIIGFYSISTAALQVKNEHSFIIKGRKEKMCTLRAPILRNVDKGSITEEDWLALDTIIIKIEDALKE